MPADFYDERNATWAAWDAAELRWRATDKAVKAAPPELSGDEDDALIAADTEAMVALMETPAPCWNAIAVKVRLLFEVHSSTDSQISFPIEAAGSLLADLDRLNSSARGNAR